MIIIALWQFGCGLIALLIRYCECKKCRKCCSRLWRCLGRCAWRLTCCGCWPCVAACRGFARCLGRCRPAGEGALGTVGKFQSTTTASVQSSPPRSPVPPGANPAGGEALAEELGGPLEWELPPEESCLPCRLLERLLPESCRPRLRRLAALLARPASQLRWYWFSVAAQVGFMYREGVVISALDGWYAEVVAANVAMWFVIIFTARQVWNFSHVRQLSPEAIDQVLDMLLLPINYGFLCALCVRILKLENTDQNRMTVLAMIDSADIWESWALWSVLGLFVKIVENASQHMVRQEAVMETRRQEKAAEAKAALLRMKNSQQVARLSSQAEMQRTAAKAAEMLSELREQREEAASSSEPESWDGTPAPEAPATPSPLKLPAALSELSLIPGRATSLADEAHSLDLLEPAFLPAGDAEALRGRARRALLRASEEGRLGSAFQVHSLDLPEPAFVPVGDAEALRGRARRALLQASEEGSLGLAFEVALGQQVADEIGQGGPQLSNGSVGTEASSPALEIAESLDVPELLVPAETWLIEGLDAEAPAAPLRPADLPGAEAVPRLRAPEVPQLLTLSDVAAHDRREDGWMILSGKVFDVTAFIPLHPGGEAAICAFLGQDATKEWSKVHAPEMLAESLPNLRSVGTLQALELPLGPPMSPPPPFTTPRDRFVDGDTSQEEIDPGGLIAPSASFERTQPHQSTGTRYLEVVNAFKKLSLSGVQAWVVILLVANMSEILVKGIIAPSVPTLCFWLYKDCLSCNDWYNLHIYSVSQGVIYILCSFALLFVVAFERVFKDYLHQIEPYWKFWGVKCVVTVTYFQWLIFKYCFGLNDQTIYLWHSLACTMEMPLLCIMHATYAYPYGKPWINHLIEEMPMTHLGTVDAAEAEQLAVSWGTSDSEGSRVHLQWCEYLSDGLRLCFYGIVTVCCCFVSVKAIMWIVPPEYDLMGQQFGYNITCTEGDVPSYIQDHAHSEHWVVPAGMRPQQGRAPGAGFRLPLCSSVSVGCQLGYRGHHSVTCTADGKYKMEGKCSIVGCGTPPKVPHATLTFNHSHGAWWAGMHVGYTCDQGYVGASSAKCGLNGSWTIFQGCTLVGCGALEAFLVKTQGAQWRDTMSIEDHANLSHSYAGDAVRFGCRPGYYGQPKATCQGGGTWSLTDPCEPFRTSLGCICLPAWEYCSGWLGTGCQEFYGCADAVQPYTWCQVDPSSCPPTANDMWGVSPPWDYCVAENFNTTWIPKPLPDRGVAFSPQLYSGVVFLGAVVLTFYCARQLTKGAIHVCCCVSVLLHKVVAPAVSRCPGAARRRWRIVAFQFHFGWRRLEIALKRSSRRLEAARSALRARVEERGQAMRQQLGNLCGELQRHADTARQRVSESHDGLQRSAAAAHSELQRRFTDASTGAGRRLSDLHTGVSTSFSDVFETAGPRLSDVRTGAERRLSDLRTGISRRFSDVLAGTGRRLSDTRTVIQHRASLVATRLGAGSHCGGVLSAPLLGARGAGLGRSAESLQAAAAPAEGDAEAAAGPAVPKAAQTRLQRSGLSEAIALKFEAARRAMGLNPLNHDDHLGNTPGTVPGRIPGTSSVPQTTHCNGSPPPVAASNGSGTLPQYLPAHCHPDYLHSHSTDLSGSHGSRGVAGASACSRPPPTPIPGPGAGHCSAAEVQALAAALGAALGPGPMDRAALEASLRMLPAAVLRRYLERTARPPPEAAASQLELATAVLLAWEGLH